MLLEHDKHLQDALNRDLDIKDIPAPPTPPADDTAFRIVLRNVQLAEEDMNRKGLPAKWADNETLYNFVVPQRTWPGTKTPRASIGVPLVLEHINAVNPQILDVIWEEDPPFAFDPMPGTSMQEARAMEALLRWALGVSDCEAEMENLSHSALLHGTGLSKCFWEFKSGYWCPKFEYVERKHMLVDASLRRPDIRKGRWKAHREYMTIDQLSKLRGKDGYMIPPDEELRALAIDPKEAALSAPNEQPGIALPEFDSTQRHEQTSANPLHHKLEVLEYVDDYYIWAVLQQKRLIRKVARKGKVEYLSAYFIRVDGQFEGIGIAGLNGNEQRLQQGLLGLLLDNLSLIMHGIWKRKNTSTVFPQQIKIEPGKVIDVNEMADFEAVRQEGIKPEAFQAIDASDSRAQRRSGANDVGVQGSFPESSGGIGRTAAGMNALTQAIGVRFRRYVKILERQVLIPYLEWLQETFASYLKPEQIELLLGKELLEELGTTPEKLLKARLKFKILGPTKMKRRAAMLQSMPTLISFYQQESTQAALKAQFQKLDFNEINYMWTDATGYPVKNNLVIDMDEQEQMQVASENELVQNLIMKRAEIQMQTDSKIQVADAEHAGRMVRDIGSKMFDAQQTDNDRQRVFQEAAGALAATRQINQASAQVPPPIQGATAGSVPIAD